MKLFIEIRKGAGGDEADIFALDLLKMYVKFAQANKLKLELVNENNPISIAIEGDGKFIEILRNESGVHRVQRVPKTERKGRVQTSTVTVAVLEIPKTPDFKVKESELRYETYRASGAGGQHRNTTDSAIRLIHIPTNTVVICANERSQHKNKDQARDVMTAKLKALDIENRQKELNKNRQNQVKTGDRAESKRTYNFQRNMVSDEQTGKVCQLKDVLDKGKLELLN